MIIAIFRAVVVLILSFESAILGDCGRAHYQAGCWYTYGLIVQLRRRQEVPQTRQRSSHRFGPTHVDIGFEPSASCDATHGRTGLAIACRGEVWPDSLRWPRILIRIGCLVAFGGVLHGRLIDG